MCETLPSSGCLYNFQPYHNKICGREKCYGLWHSSSSLLWNHSGLCVSTMILDRKFKYRGSAVFQVVHFLSNYSNALYWHLGLRKKNSLLHLQCIYPSKEELATEGWKPKGVKWPAKGRGSPDPKITMKHHFSSCVSLLTPLYPTLPILYLGSPGASSFLRAPTTDFSLS